MFCLLILWGIIPIITSSVVSNGTIINELPKLVKYLPPDLKGRHKGDGGWICIVGGSDHHSGPVYFSAISALKVGADIVTVITPNYTSPILKAYSPDLVVFPYFNTDTILKTVPILKKYDVIVIGPGLGEEVDEELITLTHYVINICRQYKKPIVIDAGGLYALSKNPALLKGYPGPVILTPNHSEVDTLRESIALIDGGKENWIDYWGSNVTVLLKGETDKFVSNKAVFNWASKEGGSWRRCPGQGNIVAGTLGTVFNWALKNERFIEKNNYPVFSQSVAAYAASKLTRFTNSRAFEQFGRSLVASNMIDNLYLAYKDIFDE